jgi:SAM-dependent methyltransferase
VDEGVDQGQYEYDVDEAVDRRGADYDAAPYDLHAFPQSAPGQLAAIAYLFGLDAPEASTARVLKIGCASGGNLIPLAAKHPEARAVGIDLSPVQIGEGRRRAQALGLGNLELVRGDIARMELAALGQIDFVISHGVYSWVPENVQEVAPADRMRSRRGLMPPVSKPRPTRSSRSTSCWTFSSWAGALPAGPFVGGDGADAMRRPSTSGTRRCCCRRLDRHLLPLLDGTRDRDALVEALTALAREEHIRLEHDGETQMRVAAAEQVDAVPQRLAGMKLWRVGDNAGAQG